LSHFKCAAGTLIISFLTASLTTPAKYSALAACTSVLIVLNIPLGPGPSRILSNALLIRVGSAEFSFGFFFKDTP